MDNETKERQPLIPVRILNEYVYCPRLAYMMWVQGEFAHSADTVEGAIRHKRVDKESGKLPVDPAEEPEEIHARSVALSSETLGITAKIDLVEGSGVEVQPVDLAETTAAIQGLRTLSRDDTPPPPLIDSPKCGRCSLIGICLPDEIGLLTHRRVDIRPIYPRVEKALPLYVQSPASYVRKDGEQLIIEENGNGWPKSKAPADLLLGLKNDMAQAARTASLESLLGVEGNVALPAVGLDPYRGFYHQMRFGRPALALDLMEPFRPLVADSTVITAINNGEVKQGYSLLLFAAIGPGEDFEEMAIEVLEV